MKNKRTQAEFIQEAINLHPEYDYSKAIYKNSDTPVLLQCKIHGEFNVTPYRLLKKGAGCQKCSIEENSKKHRLAPAKFIERAKKVFPEYDYSKTEYINSDTNVVVICHKHGEFSAKPYNLLKHHGCKKCASESNADRQKLTKEEFIARAKKKHPEYDYSKVEYKNTKTKVIISCPIHGDFSISPGDILAGKGCKQCGIVRSADKQRLSTEEFIEKAKIKYPNYNYSKVDYKGSNIKITVGCPVHGYFMILSPKLTSKGGYDCPKYGYECGASKQRKSDKDFMREIMQSHPEFDYSKTIYKSAKDNITVICKIHGSFSTTTDSLLHNKYGCPQCAIDANADKCRLTQEEFILKVKKIHPSLDYSLVNFTRTADKVVLICKKHGPFTRKANDILRGGGCPKCGIQKRAGEITKSQEDFIKEASQKLS